MDEIIKLVSEKTGLSADQAKSAVETVVNYLKTKLPAPLAGQLDSLLAGGGGQMGDIAKGIGGMFGKK
jgi:ribosomal protein L7/L12